MLKHTISRTLFASVLVTLSAAAAMADDAPTPSGAPTPAGDPTPADDGTKGKDADTDANGTPGSTAPADAPSELPKSQSDDDVAPQVASPGLPAGGLVRQAGVGGLIGYGRAGVLELGGSMGFTFASKYRSLTFSPTVGYFIADNLELSAILSVSNVKADSTSSTLWSALAEPSYHLPINRSIFAFLGVGIGASHISGLGTGFALAPRLGGNFMIGRSAVLTPSISYQYTTISTDNSGSDVTVVALTGSTRFNVSFTAMW
ncbi:MAG: hypothetical protein K8W52_42945 [Deltaproteobacteria bacterium]|nr:hypothetical protein [Deltaproteobacteria bacterium]